MRLSSCGAVASLLLLGACTTETATSSVASPAPAPAETEPAPPEPCADGTYRVASGACEAYPGLAVTRSSVVIAPARDHHTTMVIETTSGPWLYVVGGTEAWETLHADVQRAHINEDGSLGPFELAGKLPETRAGHCMVKQNDRLYVFGGVVSDTRVGPSKSSVVLQLDADGKIVSSSPGPDMPDAVMHLSCNLVGDTVYVIGGRNVHGTSATLSARTKIGVDGVASAFEKTTPLTPDRSHHAAFVKDGRLYLVGGITGDPVAKSENRKDVVFAPIAEDGSLGEWTAAGSLPTSVSVSAAQLYKDAVYVFGGLESGGFSKKIRRATFEPDGTLSRFATLASTLPDPRGHVHQTPMYKQFIYSVGGKDADDHSLDAIDVGHFD